MHNVLHCACANPTIHELLPGLLTAFIIMLFRNAQILTYYALNYAADSQLITSSTVVSIAPQGYIITNITCIIHCTCIPRQPASLLQDDNAF